jgi:hypothetical protein
LTSKHKKNLQCEKTMRKDQGNHHPFHIAG